MNDKPLIFDIVKGSFVDGKGIRTVVFFKGCPLSCSWCHNPESQSMEQETSFYSEKCIGCGNCTEGKDCFTLARKRLGVYHTPEELIGIIMTDEIYYHTSGGGVTLSGGEPLIFPEYLAEILPRLHAGGIDIAVQTSGYFDFDECGKKVLPYIKTVYFDLKLMDSSLHLRYTGKSNSVILKNFERLIKIGHIDVIPRMVLIPGITASYENLGLLAEFLLKYKSGKCEFLAYHPSGTDKLKALGKKPPDDIPDMPLKNDLQEEYIMRFKSIYESLSVKKKQVC